MRPEVGREGAASDLSSRTHCPFLPVRRYVLGLPAMQRLQEGKVLLSGLQGLGAEVAKNLVLMGVGSLTLHDPQPTCWADLAAQVRAREASQTHGVRPVRELLAQAGLGLSLVLPLRAGLGKGQG